MTVVGRDLGRAAIRASGRVITRRAFLGSGAAVAALSAPIVAQDEPDAVQRALDAAAGSGETVYLPAGTYDVGPLRWPRGVTLVGTGPTTILRAREPMGALLSLEGDLAIQGGLATRGGLQHLWLDGAGLADTGLALTNAARFHVADVRVMDCRQHGILGDGLLVAQLDRVEIVRCDVGLLLRKSAAGVPPNLITIRDAVLQGNRRRAIDATDVGLLRVTGCDIEGNGMVGDPGSVAIRIARASVNGDGLSAVLENSWIEGNHGHAAIRIEPPTFPAGHLFVLRDLAIFGGTRDYGVVIPGGSISTVYHATNVTAQNARVVDWYEGPANVFGLLDACSAAKAELRGQTPGFFLKR